MNYFKVEYKNNKIYVTYDVSSIIKRRIAIKINSFDFDKVIILINLVKKALAGFIYKEYNIIVENYAL